MRGRARHPRRRPVALPLRRRQQPARRLLRRRHGRQHARRRAARPPEPRRRVRQRPLLDPRGPRPERRGLRARLADPLPLPPRAPRLRRRRALPRRQRRRDRLHPAQGRVLPRPLHHRGDPEDAPASSAATRRSIMRHAGDPGHRDPATRFAAGEMPQDLDELGGDELELGRQGRRLPGRRRRRPLLELARPAAATATRSRATPSWCSPTSPPARVSRAGRRRHLRREADADGAVDDEAHGEACASSGCSNGCARPARRSTRCRRRARCRPMPRRSRDVYVIDRADDRLALLPLRAPTSAPLTANPKQGMAWSSGRPPRSTPALPDPAQVRRRRGVWRDFCCPGCGVRLATEVAYPGAAAVPRAAAGLRAGWRSSATSPTGFPTPTSSPQLRELTVADLLDEAADAMARPRGARLLGLRRPRRSRRAGASRSCASARGAAGAGADRRRDSSAASASGIWATNIPEWLVLQFGAAYAGVVIVPMNPLYRASRGRFVLAKAGASACFVLPENRGASLWDMLVEAAAPVLEPAPAGADRRRRRSGRARPGRSGSTRGDAVDDDRLERRRREVRPADTSQIQFTSGTTGFPKGAELSHGGIVNNARLFAHRATLPPARPPLQPDALLPLRRLRDVDARLDRHRLGADAGGHLRRRRGSSRTIEEEALHLGLVVPTMMIALEEEVDRDGRDPPVAASSSSPAARRCRRRWRAAGSSATASASTTPTG